MAQDPRDETYAGGSWPPGRSGLSHAEQIRAVLAGMPRPQRGAPPAGVDSFGLMPISAPVQVLDLPAVDISAPATADPVDDEPFAELLTDGPPVTEPAEEEPILTGLVTDEAVKRLVIEHLVIEHLVMNDPTPAPVVEEPVVEEPVVEEPIGEIPVVEDVVAEVPVVRQAALVTPVVAEPVAEAPVAEQPVVHDLSSLETPGAFSAALADVDLSVHPLSFAPPVAPPPWAPELETTDVLPPSPLPTDLGMGPLAVAPRRHRLRRAVVIALVVALLAGAAGGAYYWRNRTRAQAAPTSWDARVLSIVQFVEHARGLQFKHPVAVEFLSDARFDQVVSVPQPTSSRDRAQMGAAVRALRALGLVTGNVNLASSMDSLSQADVVGLYVPGKKTVYVRGTAMTPFVRVTLAHELTHALQDQYYGLDALQSAVQSADGSALTALVEGDATRVENAYRQTLSASDEQSYEQELTAAQQRSTQAKGVPAVLSDIAGFPYAFGVTYVDSLVAQGGMQALAGAFHNPPRSQAQILDPVDYPVTWHPVPVPRPVLPTGAHPLDTASPFGQAMLFEVLGSRVGYQQAWSAVQGWQGDNSVPYSDSGKTCVAVDVRMGSAAQAAALTGAGSAWAAASGIPGATVTQAGTLVSLRSCDPGPSVQPPPSTSPSAFDVLTARAAFIDGIVSSGTTDFALGRCVADSVITQMGPAGYGELTADSLSPAQEQSLEQLVAGAAAQCRAHGVQ